MQYTLKKSLGQHFLHDESICEKIVASLHTKDKNVVEVGPGAGAITKYLIHKPTKDFCCIEFDREKVDYLKKHYKSLACKIIQADFLSSEKPYKEPFSVIGNFPYNISTQIVFKLLDWREDVEEVVGMFQKEVAQRIASDHGCKAYGILSVLTQVYYDVEYLFDVEATAFTPPPNVMSGVIRLSKKSQPLFEGEYPDLKKFVKAAFSQRRKTLRNNLKSYYSADVLANDVFNKRIEQLSVSEVVELFNKLLQ